MNKNKQKNYDNLLDKYFGKLTKKASKISKSISKDIQPDIQLELSSKLLPEIIKETTPEEDWEFYCKKSGVCSTIYKYQEKRDIQLIYNSHKNHSAIQIPIEAKKIVDHIKLKSRTDKEIIQSICNWTSIYVDYDNQHAAASRLHKEGMNLIYLNATEVFNIRVGICGEKSLLAIGMLSYAGIPSTIYRPWFSHIAVIAKTITGQHFMCDATYNKFEEVEPITKKEKETDYYEIGVANINETYKWNWEKRRNEGLEYGITKYGRELIPEELLDTERALLCEPLKYGTLIGILEQEKMIPTCKKIEEEKKKKEAEEKLKNPYGQFGDYYNWKDEDWDEWEQWKNYTKD